MTPVREAVREAVRRGDLAWLSAHLGAADCTPAVLRLLVRQDDPRLRHLGLERLGARAARAGEPESAELAGMLPQTLDGPPETALLLAGLYERLWRHVPPRRRPRWRTAGLPAPVRIAWLRAEILHQPETVRTEPAGEVLCQAVDGITADAATRLADLVGELAGTGDPVLRGAALRLTRAGLHAALLAPGRARALIGGLLDTPDAGVAVAALRELAEPWAAFAPVPRAALTPFLHPAAPAPSGAAIPAGTPGPAGIDAAIAVAARHGHDDLLWDVVVDEAAPPGTRQAALRALGDLAGRDDISRVTAAAAADPLLLGVAAIDCLRAMHRRGEFPGDEDAAAIVDLALADHAVAPAEAATILFTCRHRAFRALLTEDPGDVRWPRRLELLVGLAAQGGGDLAVGDAVAAVLPAPSRPEPFLDAIRALRHHPAEAAVIDALPRSPGSALGALEAIGGPRTVAALADGLGLNPRGVTAPAGDPVPPGPDPAIGVVAPHLRPVRHRALALLWHLNDDPDLRRTILARLDSRDLPPRIAADLGAADPREVALLTAGADPDSPVQALTGLARAGDPGTLTTITGLLLRIVSDLAGSAVPGPTAGPPVGEPAVPVEVVTAIHALGARLHERGKLRPFCVGAAGSADEAGHALVATIGLDLLDRPGLSSGEQAVLLALLRDAPWAGTRARVHRLLRHRDRHVRKQVIALLAAGTGTDDDSADVMSASLIALTRARDRQTVRQALIALGQARARWAAPAIAAGLEHPAMNVKKTAAEALVRAGTPAVVPRLSSWLGRHDNPGLRATLVEALRAILGDAYPATVLAAAEQAPDDRTRELLLAGVDRMLSARAVAALAQQRSPVAPLLLTLVATGRVRLGSGTVEDLAEQLAAYGVAGPPRPEPDTDGPADDDVDTLVLDGWDTTTARRIADRHQRRPGDLSPDQLDRLRPMLADWLRLAESWPAALRLTLRLCPAPWRADELSTFAGSAATLAGGLGDVTGPDRDDLLAVLDAVAPTLGTAEALDVATRIRATPPAAAGRRSPLAVLRRCGAVLTRSDVEWAIAAAGLGPDPWLAVKAVLREAFDVDPGHVTTAAVSTGALSTGAVSTGAVSTGAVSTGAVSTGAVSSAAVSSAAVSSAAVTWRLGLETAVRGGAVSEFRARDDATIPSRECLAALIDVYPEAGPDTRPELLDWMDTVQPVGAPPWTLAESARRPAVVTRIPHDGDLDQPRSAAQRERLLAALAAPAASRRDAAAATLRDWPEPETRQAVLRAFLRGDAEVAITAELAGALGGLDEVQLRAGAPAVLPERVARVAAHLGPPGLLRLLPLLLDWWEHGDRALREAAERALRAVPELADAIAEHVRPRLDAGEWGFLDLLVGRPLLRTPALTATCRRLRADGRDDLAGKLRLVDGPLRGPGAAEDDAAGLAALAGRPLPTAGAADDGPVRDELFDLIRTGHTEQVRRALTQLAEAFEDDPGTGPDPELESVLAQLLHHPEGRVRLHAHRVGRRVLSRTDYLRHTTVLLDDPRPEVIRSAVGTLSHAAYPPAIPAIVGLLAHADTAVRRAAADGLVHLGRSAVPALTHAAGRARPDRRHLYTEILNRIDVLAAPAAGTA